MKKSTPKSTKAIDGDGVAQAAQGTFKDKQSQRHWEEERNMSGDVHIVTVILVTVEFIASVLKLPLGLEDRAMLLWCRKTPCLTAQWSLPKNCTVAFLDSTLNSLL